MNGMANFVLGGFTLGLGIAYQNIWLYCIFFGLVNIVAGVYLEFREI